MISWPLLRSVAARHAPFLTAVGLLLGLFQFLICAVLASIDLGSLLQSLLRSLPPLAQELIVTQFGGLSERDLLAFGWNHPVSQALGTAAAIVVASHAVAGEIETGAMELLMSQPLSRRCYLATRVCFAMLALAILTLAGSAGTLLGQRYYGLERFEPGRIPALAGSWFLLQMGWFGIGLALSAFGREGGRTASIAFLLAIVSYFGQAIGRMWSEASFVLPWTLHHYFDPRGILVQGALPWRAWITLAAVLGAGIGVAGWRFGRRDLP